MRSLVIIISTFLVIHSINQSLYAEGPNFSVASSYFSAKGQIQASRSDQENNLSSTTFDSLASTGLVNNLYRLRLKGSQIKRDVTNYNVIDRQGESSSLSRVFNGKETLFGAGGDLVYKDWTVSLDGEKTLSDSPLETKGAGGKITYNSYDTGSEISLSVSTKSSHQPESFFRELETNLSRSLPSKITQHDYKLSYSQFLTEKFKSSIFMSHNNKSQINRQNLGLGTKGFYALSDSYALVGGIESKRDLKNGLTKDNRGYFDLQAYEIGIGHELNYNFTIKALFGVTVENESARSVNPKQTVGTDAYVVGLDYRKNQFIGKFTAKMEQSNTGYQSQLISGAVSWEL